MADPTSATSTAAAQSSGGLPQFDPAPWPGEIFWALVIFLVLYLLISRVFVPRVAGTINDREDAIAGDIGQARAARDQARAAMDAAAADLVKARARAQKVAADAAAEAHAIGAARQAEEEAILAKTLAAAEARISDARADAMGHVHAIAVDTAEAMIARLTGVHASRAEIDSALAQNPSS